MLRCNLVYDEYVLKRIFIKGVPESIGHNMRSHLGTKKSTTVHDLLHHDISLTKLQLGSRTTDTRRNTGKRGNRRRSNGLKGRTVITSEDLDPCVYYHRRVLHLEHQQPLRLWQCGINSSHAHHNGNLCHRQSQQSKMRPIAYSAFLGVIRWLNAQKFHCCFTPSSPINATQTY